METLTVNIAILVGFLVAMPLAAVISVKIIRRRGGATTRAITKGAGDVSSTEWMAQVNRSAPTQEEPADIFPLLATVDEFEEVNENDPHDTGTGVFGQALRPAVLPTAPPTKPSTET